MKDTENAQFRITKIQFGYGICMELLWNSHD
jgi:hypothetical protein